MSRVLPILFNTDMVRAILDGRKTTTRRAIKNIDIEEEDGIIVLYEKYGDDAFSVSPIESAKKEMSLYSRYQPGDILYVRETWHTYTKRVGFGENCCLKEFYGYRASVANSEDANEKWRPSIHMPKEAARIWLKVKDVTVERLQYMTLDDFLSEGVTIRLEAFNDPDNAYLQARDVFVKIWDSTVKKEQIYLYGWDGNPWVWTIEFEQCEKPEPCVLKGIEPAQDKRPCLGYSRSEDDDEPCEMCKGCRLCSGNDV